MDLVHMQGGSRTFWQLMKAAVQARNEEAATSGLPDYISRMSVGENLSTFANCRRWPHTNDPLPAHLRLAAGVTSYFCNATLDDMKWSERSPRAVILRSAVCCMLGLLPIILMVLVWTDWCVYGAVATPEHVKDTNLNTTSSAVGLEAGTPSVLLARAAVPSSGPYYSPVPRETDLIVLNTSAASPNCTDSCSDDSDTVQGDNKCPEVFVSVWANVLLVLMTVPAFLSLCVAVHPVFRFFRYFMCPSVDQHPIIYPALHFRVI